MTRSRRQQLETRARTFSPLMRAFVVLLCALYVVAPLWHVCAMSGHHCEHETPQSSSSSTRLATALSEAHAEAHVEEHSHSEHSHAANPGTAHDHDSGDSAPSVAAVALCQDEEECRCAAHDSSAGKANGKAQVSPRDGGHGGTCLAMLLTTMPGRVAASFGFVPLFSQRTVAAIFSFVVRSVASLPQPPARGPPHLV